RDAQRSAGVTYGYRGPALVRSGAGTARIGGSGPSGEAQAQWWTSCVVAGGGAWSSGRGWKYRRPSTLSFSQSFGLELTGSGDKPGAGGVPPYTRPRLVSVPPVWQSASSVAMP